MLVDSTCIYILKQFLSLPFSLTHTVANLRSPQARTSLRPVEFIKYISHGKSELRWRLVFAYLQTTSQNSRANTWSTEAPLPHILVIMKVRFTHLFLSRMFCYFCTHSYRLFSVSVIATFLALLLNSWNISLLGLIL